MARKVRRKKRSVLTEKQLDGTGRESNGQQRIVVNTPRPASQKRKTVDFATEYRYVITDLRRIGVLAAVMFALMLLLNLLLR